VTDSDIIARTVDIHNEILNNRSYLRRIQWEAMTGGDNDFFPITYILRDGTHIYRMYTLSHAFMEQHGINDLLNERIVLLAHQVFFQNTERMTGIDMTISSWYQDNLSINVSGQARIASLIEAVKEDHLRERIWQDEWDGQRSWLSLHAQWQASGHTQSTWMSVTFFEDGAVADWLREHGYIE